MGDRIENVLILGGGTAGWMTASYLAKALGGTAEITVLEAPAVPRIGVGEATIPNLQSVFFDFLGLKESDWMPECNASFKSGIRFINWRTPGEAMTLPRTSDSGPDYFHHVFGLLPEHDGLPLSHYWVQERDKGELDPRFDYACYWQPALMDADKAPCWTDGRPASSYAWHFDANLVAAFLQRLATTRLGVRHVADRMVDVELDDRGFIAALHTEQGQRLDNDLFVDCSGFRGLLINEAMGEPFVDMSDHLLCDSAVATAVPHDDDTGVEPYTSAIAMPSGWTWKIPLLDRFGTGYVYASRFCDEATATRDFCRMWDLNPEATPLNKIRFRVGRNRRAWVHNCVSIGLSSCFLEPLESTGIYFITAAIYHLARNFPDKTFDEALTANFNREIETMFDDSRDFIQAHFAFSPRTDTPFWRANHELALSPNFSEKMEMYDAGIPVNTPVVDVDTYYHNFEAEFRNYWTNGSYYCVLAGLGRVPRHPLPILAHRPTAVQSSKVLFDEIKQNERKMLSELPTMTNYLRLLHHR
jgi:tryptophan 6-halogenase